MLPAPTPNTAEDEAPALLEPNTRFNSMCLETLLLKVASGSIDLNPPYQRGNVWNERSQMRLIQSIAIGMFIPEVLFKVTDEDVLEAVDGKQRMTGLMRFFKGEIPLRFESWVKDKHPEIYAYYNMKYFIKADNAPEDRPLLKPKERRHFLNYSLRYSYLEKSVSKETRDRTFNIINTSSAKLTTEENVNGQHNGSFLDILHHIARAAVIHKSVPVPLSKMLGEDKVRRMKYINMFTRIIYLTERLDINPFNVVEYSKKTVDSKHLENFIIAKNREFAAMDDVELAVNKTKYRKMLVGGLRRCFEVFGETAFATAKHTPSQTNNVLFETLMLGFNKTTGDLKLCKKELTTKLDELLKERGAFYSSISHHSTDTAQIKVRNKTWFGIIRDTLLELELRVAFPPELKAEMYTEGMTCKWCNTALDSIADAHIDHAVSLNKGGTSDRNNLQLLHKLCNLRKRTLAMQADAPKALPLERLPDIELPSTSIGRPTAQEMVQEAVELLQA